MTGPVPGPPRPGMFPRPAPPGPAHGGQPPAHGGQSGPGPAQGGQPGSGPAQGGQPGAGGSYGGPPAGQRPGPPPAAPRPGPMPGPPGASAAGNDPADGTGHPAVHAVLQSLANAAQLAPAEQVAAYEEAHRTLQETLAGIDRA